MRTIGVLKEYTKMMLFPVLFLASVLEVSPQGELKSPAEALHRIRDLRGQGAIAKDELATVRLSAGVYPLFRPIRMTAADSYVSFEGAENGKSVILGGVELGRFSKSADGVWRTKVPAGLQIDQLWVGGRRADRAVSPNGDAFYHHIRFNEAESNGCLVAKEDYPLLNELAKLPKDELANVAVHVYYAWDTEWLRPNRIDPKSGFLGFTAKAARDFFLWKKWVLRFKVENYRAALDAPGEWFFDRKSSELLYIPRADDDLETAIPFVPTVERLVEIAGDGENGPLVCNVSFSRIGFSGQAWHMPNSLAPHQAAKDIDAAIKISNARAVRFTRCRFDRTATHAVWFAKNCRDSGVSDSLFADLGAGAVRIGAFERTTDVPCDKFTGNIVIDNNIVVGGGRLFPEAVGVQIVYAADCRITHNEIADFYYTGISVGWGWNYTPTQNRNNLIAYNHIHDIGKGVMCDMGGIYHLSEDLGSRIEGNVIHHVRSYRYTGSGGTGIYMDEASGGLTITSNLVYDVWSGAAHQHYGRDNIFANNIFAYVAGGGAVVTRVRIEPHLSFAFKNNIVVWGSGSNALRVGDTKKGIDFASNVYWSADALDGGEFDNVTFSEWMKDGKDAGSLFADPKFRDPKNGDFALAKDSPALALGFVPWDVGSAGVRGEAWRRKAKSFEMRPDVDIPEPARYRGIPKWATDFEEFKIGSKPKFPLRSHGEGIAIVNDDARPGKRVLKIADSKSKPGFDPYVTCAIPYAPKRLTFSYALKYHKDANFVQEWREHKEKCRNGQYATGLWVRANAHSFRVSGSIADGKGGFVDKEFCLPTGGVDQWLSCRLEMRFAPGERVRCVFTLQNEKGESSSTGEFFGYDEFVNPNWTAFFAWGGNDTDYLIGEVSYTAE